MRSSWRLQPLTEQYAQRSACGSVRYATRFPQVLGRPSDLGPTPHPAPVSEISMSQPQNSNYARRVVLPSGRAIEVVYFENQPAHAPQPAAPPHAPLDLHVCPDCDKQLVYPVEWEEASATHWEVQLRCPSCEWTTVGLYDQETVDRFDEYLDSGTEALIRDLKHLTRANMEEEADRFTSALASDAIWPMDF